MIPAYRKKSNSAAAVVLATVVALLAFALFGDETQQAPQSVGMQMVGPLIGITIGLAFAISCWYYIKAKGRSGWWILVMVFNIVGLIILALLKDHAKGPANGDPIEAVPASVATNRKWVNIAKIDNLNGWQRLWVLLTILWIVPVGFLMYPQWPSPDSARIAGCMLPGELFSLAAPAIINDELTMWRRELPENLVFDQKNQSKTQRQPTSPEIITWYEATGFMRWFPEWKGDSLGRPEWAKAPWVKAYCTTLVERLERSGRAAQLRDASTKAMQKPRIEWLALVLAACIGPAVAVYLLGLAVVWVTRGFRKPR